MWRSLWFTACAEVLILVAAFIVARTVTHTPDDLVIDGTRPGSTLPETLLRGRSYVCRPPRA